MDFEVVAVDGVPQVVLEAEAVARPGVHVGVEHLVARLAARLRLVHRGVGVAHDLVGVEVLREPDRDADAGRREDLAAADRERRAQRLLDAEGDHVGLLLLDEAVQQDRELVAAQPGQRVALPQAAFEAAGDRDQQLVADEVAEAVVDHLEPIEIEIQDGEPVAVAPLLELVEAPAQAFDEQRAVAQASQRIQEPGAAQPLLRERPFGRVGQRPGDPHRPLAGASHRHAAAQEPAVAAVLVAQPVLVLEVLGPARQVRVERLLERRGVLRVNAANPLIGAANSRRRGQPQHRAPPRRDVELLRPQVPFPQSVDGAFGGKRKPLLAPLQRPFDAGAFGDVAPEQGQSVRHRNDPHLEDARALRHRQLDMDGPAALRR